MRRFYSPMGARPGGAPLFTLLAGMLLLALTLGACSITIPTIGVTQGSGTQKTETRSVSGFTRVTLSGIGTLNIQQTGTESLTITTDDNISAAADIQCQRRSVGARREIGVHSTPH